MPMTESGIDSTLLRDIYVSMGEPLEGGAWNLRLHHKPLVVWIWLGCVVMALGGMLAVIDRRYRVAARRREAVQATGLAQGAAGGGD